MGKNKGLKKYVNVSGFNIHQPNRGNAALSYGAISFLYQNGYLHEGQELIRYQSYANFLRKRNVISKKEYIKIDGKIWIFNQIPIFFLEKKLVMKYGIILPFTRFGRTVKHIALEAADYGGDGFSDIYGDDDFLRRMNQTFLLWKAAVPLVMLPQTVGPFKKEENLQLALKIMRYAKKIFVRDEKFKEEFLKYGIAYSKTKDISSFMHPESWDINIAENAVGLNVSGLMYSNNFKGLENQFDNYPELIDKIINHYCNKGMTVYLIPHSYTYNAPDDNDDMVACRDAYNRLNNNDRVVLIDRNMTAPQVKYIISKMKYFIGGRMHANFAAIYTGVPVFGMAYSYKFQGAFDANGLDGKTQTEMVNNIKVEAIHEYINKIDRAFNLQ